MITGILAAENRMARPRPSGPVPPITASVALLGKGIDHQLHIISKRVQNRAGSAALDVLLNLLAALLRRSRGGDELDNLVGHHLHRFSDLLLGRRPGENLADTVEHIVSNATRLHDMWLLT